MKEYYGNYLGICINNQDPEYRGRVQIFIPHIMPALYEGWNQEGQDITIECVGNNLPNGLNSAILEKLTKILPWSEGAMPIVGASVGGQYNPATGNFNQTASPESSQSVNLNLNDNLTKFVASIGARETNFKTSEANSDYYNAVSTVPGQSYRNANVARGVQQEGLTLQQAQAKYGDYGFYQTNQNDVEDAVRRGVPREIASAMNNGGGRGNYTVEQQTNAIGAYIKVLNPKAAAAASQGDWVTANNLLNGKWPSLPGGKSYRPSNDAAANSFLTGGKKFDLNQPAAAPSPGAFVPGPPAYMFPDGGPYYKQQPDQSAITGTTQQSTESNFVTNGANMVKLNTDFRNRVESMAAEYKQLTGQKMRVMGPRSAYRTFQEQVAIFGTARPGYAAPPGTSNHGFGFALDVVTADANKANDLGLISKYRLTRPFVGAGSKIYEPWHIEPIGLDSSKLAPYKARKESGKFTGDQLAFALDPNATVPESLSTNPDSGPGNASSTIFPNPSPTQIIPTDVAGIPAGTFAIPGPGAMLWVFFREGNPLFPVYFAASYGRTEWQNAYQANSQPSDYGLTTVQSSGPAGATITINNLENPCIRNQAFNGSYTENDLYGRKSYVNGNNEAKYDGSWNLHTNGRQFFNLQDDIHNVLGNTRTIVGNPSQECFDKVEEQLKYIKEINQPMLEGGDNDPSKQQQQGQSSQTNSSSELTNEQRREFANLAAEEFKAADALAKRDAARRKKWGLD